MTSHSRFAGERRYRVHPDVVTEHVGEELLLVQLAYGTTFRLNATGVAIWNLAITGRTTTEIAEQLHAPLGAPAGVLGLDARELLTELARNALIEPRPETDP
jgi:hypothetical protein